MASFCVNNRDIACYLVTKHSWKGKYRRIFSIGTLAITTYNPQTLEITNQWLYEDFVAIRPVSKSGNESIRGEEFVIHTRKKGKSDTMRFSSEFAQEILAQALSFQSKFSDQNISCVKFPCVKHSWSDQRLRVSLEIASGSVNQINQQNVTVASYLYKDIKQIIKMKDYPGGFILEMGDQRRRHLFSSESTAKLVSEICNAANENIGLPLSVAKDLLSFEDFMTTRLGLCSKDEQLTSYVEFKAQKFSPRHENGVTKRLLCLSETCIIERDAPTYYAICARPLKTIVCLVRSLEDPQKFQIVYENGESRNYASNERDIILASLVDGARASGNYQIFVTSRMERSLRLMPFKHLLDEEGETQLMRHITSVPPGLKRSEMIRRFNANVPYNGLTYSQPQEGFFTENKGRVIVGCLESVLAESYTKDEPDYVLKVEAQLACLHRLFASKSGFHAFTSINGVREKLGQLVIASLKFSQEAIDYATVEMLCSLMQPMHPNYELRVEQTNKQSLLSSKAFVEHLLQLVVTHVERGTGCLVIASMLDFLTYTVCAPYSETTTGETFDLILELVAKRGRAFYKLFHSPSMTIIKGAGLVMRAIIEESTSEFSRAMQMLSLTEGAFLKHLHMALLSTGRDLRVLTNKQLSGHLIALWIAENSAAMELLRRCIPRGLLDYLDSTEKVPQSERDYLLTRNNLEIATQETRQSALSQQLQSMQITIEARLDTLLQHWNLEQKLSFLQKKEDKNQRPVILRKRRRQIKTTTNWKMFCYQFSKDHAKADLIWNEKTREEFRQSIENELRTLQQETEFLPSGTIMSWNHAEFGVIYSSLIDEIKIGDYYLRFLLTETDNDATPIHNPMEFFNNVYHRFLLSTRTEMKCICLKAMGVAYERHCITIGSFEDSKFIVSMLSKCINPAERDHLLFLISKLALDKNNVRELIAADVLPLLIDLAVLAHLHVSRAKIHSQTNVIESSGNQDYQAKEWYYNGKDGQRQGPFSFEEMKNFYKEKTIFEKTEIWAEGLDKWYHLSSVAQFRWTLGTTSYVSSSPDSGTGAAALPTLYNFTELCVLILDTLIQMCTFFPSRDESDAVIRPLPKVKKILSEPVLLYQIVQLLLTYDPSIVQRVATLLLHVMQDNPFISRLYLSGVFFFILMYNGSNILPIARFLYTTHMKQAFRSTLSKSEMASKSVLCPMLPEATIFYLEEYGAEKYAEVFLGEFENPEIIWNSQMRRHMIEKIAIHVADFSSRLTSNIKALYRYCPIPPIEYEQLNEELFCHFYYLRHFCDETRFPNWPIRDPVMFLRACLASWHEEIDKKPVTMSIEDACAQLGLSADGNSWQDQSLVRRAYFKLAQKYHPDKNPDGREIFEQINYAYEFLTSTLIRSKNTSLPDAQRIILCLKSQSIIYSRHYEELSPYKYAGYAQLIKTIRMESTDDALFANGGGQLLCAAVELCYWTLRSSALNAEQLRRDGGLDALYETFERCVPMVSLSSKKTDMHVQICLHSCNCFDVAAQFDSCRDKISEMKTLFNSLCRLLKFENLVPLAVAAAECVCSFSVCTLLQTQLFQAGVLWQLLPHLFKYDYTLDEGGVSHSEESNQQSILNKLALASCEALACLAGFREGTPENDGVQNSLRAMLTPYVCRLMRNGDNHLVLKVLNSNLEDPYMIWDNGTRAELLEFVEKHRNSNSELFGAEFRISVYAKELVIGDIFVRIYNAQPEFKLHEPKKVTMDLLDYLQSHVDEIIGEPKKLPNGNSNNGTDNLIDLSDWEDVSPANRLEISQKVDMCLEALYNVLATNPGVEILLIGHFLVIFKLLRAFKFPAIQLKALKIISISSGNKECVNDMACSFQLSLLFVLLVKLPKSSEIALKTLIALVPNSTMVKNMLDYGGLLYILDVFCDATTQQTPTRLLAAELLAKLQSDKLTGPRWTRFIVKFLPTIFADSLRDNSSNAITMFDNTTENPELIWNENSRKLVIQTIRELLFGLLQKQIEDPNTKWNAAQVEQCVYDSMLSGELIVGGVFIRLFNDNPSYTVRHPKQFATELMEKVLELMQNPNDNLTPITQSFVSLIYNHPSTADQIPAQGYLPQFCQAMQQSKNPQTARSALLILHQLSENTFCADSLATQPIIKGIYVCMKQQPSLIREAAHSLKFLMQHCTSDLAGQLLTSGIMPYLLEVLGSNLPGVENSPAAKAELVDALKSACRDPQYGQKITDELNKSTIWSQYRDQRHDLFLPASRTQAITGPTGSSAVAGYLTDGMFTPPPRQNAPAPPQ
uniref:J domain-containing protein n=1 Tax=Acrobeloides nanus TaxID=290746 RepID=A0A914BXU0_9BILA